MIKLLNVKKLNTHNKIEKLLKICAAEADTNPSSYDVHVISKNLKISAPKIDKTMEKLEKKGYYAFRTHFSPTAIKTDAPLQEIKKVIKELSSTTNK